MKTDRDTHEDRLRCKFLGATHRPNELVWHLSRGVGQQLKGQGDKPAPGFSAARKWYADIELPLAGISNSRRVGA